MYFFPIFNIYWYVFKKQAKNQVTYSQATSCENTL